MVAGVTSPSADSASAFSAAFWVWPSDTDADGNTTAAGSGTTVSLHLAFLLLKVLTVMVALPAPTAVIRPVPSTVATFSSLLVQVSVAEAVPFGNEPLSWKVMPVLMVSAVVFSVILPGAALTVTLQATSSPSSKEAYT